MEIYDYDENLNNLIVNGYSDDIIIANMGTSNNLPYNIPILLAYNNRYSLIVHLWRDGCLNNEDLEQILRISFEMGFYKIAEFVLNLNLLQCDLRILTYKAIMKYRLDTSDTMKEHYISFFLWMLEYGFDKEFIPEELVESVLLKKKINDLDRQFKTFQV